MGWIADKTVFRVEPEIPSDDTKPGVRTVARGRELVAQSLDGQTDGYVEGLLYRSKYLLPSPRNALILQTDVRKYDQLLAIVRQVGLKKSRAPLQTMIIEGLTAIIKG